MYALAMGTLGRVGWLTLAGPFEFTKLSAQIELLMLRSKRSSLDDPSHIRKYKNKGTWQGAKDIVKSRGLLGLYSGFHLHFSESRSAAPAISAATDCGT
jgi:solute carrier family 25 carnitine/acylcarnitine transporter 20/29